MRFWDSSALVAIIVSQPQAETSEAWLSQDSEVVVWALSETEIRSAIWRLVREKRLTDKQAIALEAFTVELLAPAHVVVDFTEVQAIAARLLRLHPLRAADALQLAAALVWAEGHPAGKFFCCFDARLVAAAEKEGFAVGLPGL